MTAAVVSLPWWMAGYYLGSWFTVIGLLSRTEYVDEGTGYHYLPLVQAAGDLTPEDARLMLLFEHRGFYLPRRHVIGTPFFQENGFTPPERFAEPTRVMDMLARNRITHVIIAKAPRGPDHAPEWRQRLEPFFRSLEKCAKEGRLQVIWESDAYLLLKVR
jgi:hypothetical protein